MAVRKSTLKAGLLGLLLLWAAGCIGTDLVDDPPQTVEPRITIDPQDAAVEQGEAVDFEATYYDDMGEAVPNTAFTWTSSSPDVASVDASGHVTTHQPGQVTITASANDVVSDPAMVTVVSDTDAVARIVVSPDSVTLDLGQTQIFTASAMNVDGEPVTGKTFTWSSSNTDVATIDANGEATAEGPGTTDIVARADGISSMPAQLAVRGRSRSGTFTARPGTSYNVEGTAVLRERPDGGLRLAFEDDFRSSDGPGLKVYLSTTNAVGANSIQLGDLIQTSGAQNYTVPPSVELFTYDWVIIHCVPFNVTFGYARLN